jgi:S1-C subfamily serine protease
LQVGDPVVAVGTPFGLSGTLTTGVISALGRTITEDSSTSQSSGPTISDIIQTSTAINPGNSGGPLINYEGNVVGITTAAVSNSNGLGFAIPSETIIRELNSLVTSGSYNQHPTINAQGTDMNYQIAQAAGVNITYGWLVECFNTERAQRRLNPDIGFRLNYNDRRQRYNRHQWNKNNGHRRPAILSRATYTAGSNG